MRPSVISIRQAPRGWTKNSAYVYIGRERIIEGVKFQGEWGNPHPVGYLCPQCSKDANQQIVHPQGRAIAFFERDLRARLALSDPELVERLKSLDGKILVCFCKPNPCHGDVLADLCEELTQEDKNNA